MSRSPKEPVSVSVIAAIMYVLLSLMEKKAATSPAIMQLLHDSAQVAFYVAVGAVLVGLMVGAIGKRLAPVIRDSLSELSRDLARQVGIGIREGFGILRTAVSNLTPVYSQTFEQIRKTAENSLEPREENEIAKLLLSNDKGDLERAAVILARRQIADSNYVRTIKNYTTLAYKFWSIGLPTPAIDSAQKGLDLAATAAKAQGVVANSQKLPELESALKNGLAYYYAETGKAEFEDLARQYAAESLASQPQKWEMMDTQGFVWIVYGKTKEEVKKGLKMCGDAWALGLPDEAYHRDSERAFARLKAFD